MDLTAARDGLRARLRPGSLAREAGVLVGMAGASQVLLVAASPVLSRLYDPTDFGVLAVFMSLLTIAFVVVALRYDQAIALPQDPARGVAVLGAALAAVVAVSGLSAVLVLAFREPVAELVGEPSLAPWLLLLPVTLLGAGVYQCLVGWAVRQRETGVIGRTRLTQAVAQLGVQLAAGIVAPGPGGLIGGVVVGRAAGSGRLAVGALRRGQLRPRPTRRDVLHVARRYRRFPLLGAPAALCNATAVELAPIVLAAGFDAATAGLFLLGNRLVGAPLNLVGQSVSQVYSSRFAAALRTRPADVLALFQKTTRLLALLGAVPALVLLAAGPELVALVLGEQWREAGVYARLLAPMFWAQLAVFPIEPSLGLLERQDVQLWRDLGRLGAVVGAFALAFATDLSARWTVALYGLTMTVAYLVIYLLARREVHRAATAGAGSFR